jgi:hypothetical protein
VFENATKSGSAQSHSSDSPKVIGIGGYVAIVIVVIGDTEIWSVLGHSVIGGNRLNLI